MEWMSKPHKDRLDIKPPRQNKTRVLVDLDGVVRDFVGSLIRVYKKVYPDHHIKPVSSRELEKYFPAGAGVYKFMEPGYIEDIVEGAEAYPGAVEALQTWESEFEIVIVTAQPPFVRASTFTWIGRHRIPTNEVHINYYKYEIDGVALLDDFVDNLEEFAGTGRLAVCLDQPWNRHWKGPRVKSVGEFFELVQDYLKGDKRESISNETYLT